MSGQATVGGAHGPSIAGEDGFAGAAGDDGLNRDDQAFGEEIGRGVGQWNAGLLVDVRPMP